MTIGRTTCGQTTSGFSTLISKITEVLLMSIKSLFVLIIMYINYFAPAAQAAVLSFDTSENLLRPFLGGWTAHFLVELIQKQSGKSKSIMEQQRLEVESLMEFMKQCWMAKKLTR